MKRYLNYTLSIMTVFIMSLLTACSNKNLYNEEEKTETTTKDVSTLFDFSTTQTITLSLDYGITGLAAKFKVFTQDPLDSIGTLKSDVQPIFIGYTDSNCKYTGKLTLPASITKLYLYSTYTNIPYCITVNIENGTATYTNTKPTLGDLASKRVSSRVSSSGESINIGTNYSQINGNLYSLYSAFSTSPLWAPYSSTKNLYTQIDNNATLSSNSTLGELINRLNTSLDASKTGQDNSKYIKDTQHVNTTIASRTASGEAVDGAHLTLTYITATGWKQNAMAYYYYPSTTTATATYIKGLPKYVVFPRTSGHYYYGGGYHSYPNAVIGARLQFFGPNYDQPGTDTFPPGYTIGWLLIADIGGTLNAVPYTSSINSNIATSYNSDKVIYSNKEANNYQNPGCITLYDKKSEKVIIGFEDLAYKQKSGGKVGDNSYNDILFYVDADPIAAIYDPDQPTVPDAPAVVPDDSYQAASGTLAFEDIWPNGGDYDLNDVVVEYSTKLVVNETNIKQIIDTYKVVNKTGAATKSNAFGFVINDSFGGTIASDSPEFTKEEDNQYILFNNAKNCIGKTFTVTRTFSEGSYPQTSSYTKNYNPFIVPDYVAGAKNRIEVHLPKASATSWASSNNGGDNAYYVNKDGKYPFAIDLAGVSNFNQVTESKSIGSTGEYPLFIDWVNAKGADYKDWYLYKNGK